ncbi:hypothetical protein WNZ14_18550 [Hoeflea sp. AS60]|uniref:hypothetical protein n=1 Tax=Hoeflea sp. AS60 TaxID=3135780 RepID=UPI003181A1BC
MEKAGNCHARMIAAVSLVVAGLASSAIADTQPTYDKRIEEAAIRMLVPKLGEMRGSLDPKSNEFLRPIANEQIIERQQAVMDTLPVESAKAPEDGPVVKDRQIVTNRESASNRPAGKALQATRAPQISEDRGEEQAAPSQARRSKGSFLFF